MALLAARERVSGSSLQKSQVFSDGHRPQVGRGAGGRNRVIARIGLRQSLDVAGQCCTPSPEGTDRVQLGPTQTQEVMKEE